MRVKEYIDKVKSQDPKVMMALEGLVAQKKQGDNILLIHRISNQGVEGEVESIEILFIPNANWFSVVKTNVIKDDEVKQAFLVEELLNLEDEEMFNIKQSK